MPLDDRPLAESQKILVQVGTVARPSGWIARQRSVEADGQLHGGLQIMRKGDSPVLIENTMAEVILANPTFRKAIAPDINGHPTDGQVPVQQRGGKLYVTLPSHTLYTVMSAD